MLWYCVQCLNDVWLHGLAEATGLDLSTLTNPWHLPYPTEKLRIGVPSDSRNCWFVLLHHLCASKENESATSLLGTDTIRVLQDSNNGFVTFVLSLFLQITITGLDCMVKALRYLG
jgi:hypothetical protein